MMKSGLTMITKLTTASEVDCVLLAVFSALGVLAMHAWNLENRAPTALILSIMGLIIAAVEARRSDGTEVVFQPGWPPYIAVESLTWSDVWNGFLKAGLAQLPLTTLNSIVSVCDLNNKKLFPDDATKYISLRSVASSVGFMNLSGLWFGAMPMCHGAGGLAAQHSFGARTGAAIIILGTVKMILAILLDNSAETLLTFFPKSILGVLLMFAGLTLSLAGLDLSGLPVIANQRPHDPKIILLATAVVTLTLKTGWGFLAGIIVSVFHHGFDHVIEFVKQRWEARKHRNHAQSVSRAESSSNDVTTTLPVERENQTAAVQSEDSLSRV